MRIVRTLRAVRIDWRNPAPGEAPPKKINRNRRSTKESRNPGWSKIPEIPRVFDLGSDQFLPRIKINRNRIPKIRGAGTHSRNPAACEVPQSPIKKLAIIDWPKAVGWLPVEIHMDFGAVRNDWRNPAAGGGGPPPKNQQKSTHLNKPEFPAGQ